MCKECGLKLSLDQPRNVSPLVSYPLYLWSDLLDICFVKLFATICLH
jgi:hypothetical protein